MFDRFVDCCCFVVCRMLFDECCLLLVVMQFRDLLRCLHDGDHCIVCAWFPEPLTCMNVNVQLFDLLFDRI